MATTAQAPGLPVFLQEIFDFGTGLFRAKADIELGSQQVEVAKYAAQAAASDAKAAAARQDQVNGVAGIDQKTLLIIGAALVGALIIARL